MSIEEILEILRQHRRRIQSLEEMLEEKSHETHIIPDSFHRIRIFDDEEDEDYEDDLDDIDDVGIEDEMPPVYEVGFIGVIKWFMKWHKKFKKELESIKRGHRF